MQEKNLKLNSGRYKISKLNDDFVSYFALFNIDDVSEIRENGLLKDTILSLDIQEMLMFLKDDKVILEYRIPKSEIEEYFSSELRLKRNINKELLKNYYYNNGIKKNPPIWLYHATKLFKVRSILREGLLTSYTTSEAEATYGLIKEMIESGEIENEQEFWDMGYGDDTSKEERARDDLNRELKGHYDSIFFSKEMEDIKIPNAIEWKEVRILKIRADKIPCLCKEADNDLSDEIYDLLYRQYDEDSEPLTEEEEEGLYNLIERYNESIMPLDIVKKGFKVEVMCPCNIPSKDIIPRLADVIPEEKKLTFSNWKIPTKEDILRKIEKIKNVSVDSERILENFRGKVVEITPEFDFLIGGRERHLTLDSLLYSLKNRRHNEWYKDNREGEYILKEIYNKFKKNESTLMPLIVDIDNDLYQLIFGDLEISMAQYFNFIPKGFVIDIISSKIHKKKGSENL